MSNMRPSQAKIGHIQAESVTVTFAHQQSVVTAIENISFEIQPHEFVCFLGTSGCGKSTILNVVAGYLPPASGVIKLDGNPIVLPGPDRVVIFQQLTLFPWLTIVQNVEFGLRMTRMPRVERRALATRQLEKVGLKGFEQSYPGMLSGGMQQRVEIARALVLKPPVMLMDEPFGSLDAQTRLTMHETLLDVCEQSATTVLFVTHDVDEAIFLADRVIILTARPGKVKNDIHVTFPRPRLPAIVASPEYARLKLTVLESIREEAIGTRQK